jgi:hypothetical protein
MKRDRHIVRFQVVVFGAAFGILAILALTHQ